MDYGRSPDGESLFGGAGLVENGGGGERGLLREWE